MDRQKSSVELIDAWVAQISLAFRATVKIFICSVCVTIALRKPSMILERGTYARTLEIAQNPQEDICRNPD
jgi:hypothetical protein